MPDFFFSFPFVFMKYVLVPIFSIRAVGLNTTQITIFSQFVKKLQCVIGEFFVKFSSLRKFF